MNRSDVAVVGLGKLGLPLAAVLADAGHHVIGCDTNPDVVVALRGGRYETPEPDVRSLLAQHPLADVTDDPREAGSRADVTFVVTPTPSDVLDRFDATSVVHAAAAVAAGVRPGRTHTIVVVSTVMPGTCEGPILRAVRGANPSPDIRLAYHPEFIALGTVVHDLCNPSVVYLGADDRYAADTVADVLGTFVPADTPQHRLTLREAEVAKLAVNVYLSVKIGYANEVAAVARSVGADPSAVLGAVGDDRRIGRTYLRHGAPPSGPCLPRDVRAWATVCDHERGARSRFAVAAERSADDVVSATVATCVARLPATGTVGILGYAYKPGGFIADESYGWRVAESLAVLGYTVRVHDPYVTTVPRLCQRVSVDDAAASDLVVMGCDHDAYAALDVPGIIRP